MISPFLANIIVYSIAFIIIGIFLKIKPIYRQNIIYVLGNIKLLYTNYVHWSVSKLIIYIYGWILALIISTPLLALLVYLLYKTAGIIKPEWINTYINESKIDYGVVTALLQHPFLMLSVILILFTIFLIFILSFMYAYFLQQRIYINYLVGNKLPYFSKNFLDWKTMKKYLGVIFWVAMYMLIPIGIVFFYVLLLLGLSRFESLKSIIFGENMIVGIFQLIVFVSLFIYFIYMGIRLSFSYICLLYTTDSSRTSYSYVNESLNITKGNIWKIIGIGAPFFIVSILLENIFSFLESINYYVFLAMNIVDFFVFSGMSLMIYISLYRIVIGKSVNSSVINKELSVEKYSKPAEIISEKVEQVKEKKAIKKTPNKTSKKLVTKKPISKTKKKVEDIDLNNL